MSAAELSLSAFLTTALPVQLAVMAAMSNGAIRNLRCECEEVSMMHLQSYDLIWRRYPRRRSGGDR
jgi:hypothetical protein